mgnify:CR=1 FL=1
MSHYDKNLDKNNTIIFTYTPEENENGSLLYIHAINDYNMGINIDFQTSMNIKNYLIVTISNSSYVYNIGLINNPLIFVLVSLILIFLKGLNFGIDFKGGTLIELRIDSNIVKISNTNNFLVIFGMKIQMRHFLRFPNTVEILNSRKDFLLV